MRGISTNQKPGNNYWRTKSEIDQSEARKLLFTDANIFYMNTKFRQVIQFNLELQGVNMSNVIPKILNFNLIDNLTSNPKQTKKRNFKQFCKKFLRFFCFDAGDEDDYIITNSFSPPGANSEYEEDKSKITFRPYTVIIEYDPRESPYETFQTKQSRIASLKEFKANSPKYKPKRLKYK